MTTTKTIEFSVASRSSLGGLVALAMLSASGVANGQTDCTTLTNPVYFPATTLLEGYLDDLAPFLADPTRGDDQMTIVYLPLSSCNTYDYTLDPGTTPFVGTMRYWDPDGTQLECEVAAGSTLAADLNAMDVGGNSCRPTETPPSDVREFPGHVEVIGFVVPAGSSQTAITATEGYYIMKFGGETGRQVPPWTDPDFVVIRNPGSSTQLTIGAAIGWSGTLWSGNLSNTNSGSSDVRDKIIALANAPQAENTIGILNSGKWDRARDTMQHLAFQAFNNCIGAVYADSTQRSFDKRNVRDGHYPIWTNLRFVTRVDANGEPVNPRVANFIQIALGNKDIGFNTAESLVNTGNIPACAMHVQRVVDGGPISPFDHPAPCDCFFDETVQPGSTSCSTCAVQADCASGTCRNGWCEER